jgi:hypothetical protein
MWRTEGLSARGFRIVTWVLLRLPLQVIPAESALPDSHCCALPLDYCAASCDSNCIGTWK